MAMERKREGFAPVGGEIRVAPPEAMEIETPAEAEAEVVEMKAEAAPKPEVRPVAAARPVEHGTPIVKDRFRKEIESVLSADLRSLYEAMSPAKQQVFRERGEQIAELIQRLLQ